MTVRLKHPEDILQASCVRWFDYNYPHLRELMFAIPNGGKRTKFEAIMFKMTGVKKGVADMFLSVSGFNGNVHGLYIEMKTMKPKTYQSPEQKKFMRKVREQGFGYIVCRSVDEFIEVVEGYFNKNDVVYNKITM